MTNEQYKCVFGSLFHLERNKYCLTFTINIESSLIHSMNIFKISVCFKITYLMHDKSKLFSAFKSNIFLIKIILAIIAALIRQHYILLLKIVIIGWNSQLFSLGDKTNLLAFSGERYGVLLKHGTEWKTD